VPTIDGIPELCFEQVISIFVILDFDPLAAAMLESQRSAIGQSGQTASLARPGLRVAAWRQLLAILLGALWLFASTPGAAQVVWEDYQGNSGMLGSSGQDLPGPNFANNTGTDAQRIAALKTISANAANASRTGTATAMDFTAANSALCSLVADPAGTGAACQADAQGRVLWTVLKFPAAGTYTFSIAHDDQVDVDMSSAFSATDYKNAAYEIPVGSLNSYTANDTTYENVPASFAASAINSCVLVRIYWVNAGGINHLRLRWTKPGGTTEIIPAAQFNTPGQSAAALGCVAGTVTTAQTSIMANKIIAATGRADAADQFSLNLMNGATLVTAATTSGSGTGQQASTGAQTVTVGTSYTITDAMAAGSGATIVAYTPTIACTRNGAAFTPGGSAPSWTVSATAANQAVVCNITNTRRTATLQLRKQWVNAVVNDAAAIPATTGFSSNTAPLAAIANTPSEIDTGSAVTVLVGETGTLAAETITAGVPATYTKTLSCTGASPAGADAAAANSLTIPTTAGGTMIVCTYLNTNSPRSDLVATKSNGSSTVFAGQSTTYVVTVTNNGPSAVTGAVVTDVAGSRVTCPAGNAVTIAGPGAPAGSYTVANLTGAGIALATLANGQSTTLTYTCTVN
jgi:uncharacterized repeat protein (TIGR01451 family)